MSMLSFPLVPKAQRAFLFHHLKPLQPGTELDALVARIRHRLYPESVPVLASYWLKTVNSAGHHRGWWRELNAGIENLLRETSLEAGAVECLREIHSWIEVTILRNHKTPERRPRLLPPFRANLTPEQVKPYLCRLLNEWLPAELARLLTTGTGIAAPQDGGIPVLAVGIAIERLLARERLSPESLEMILQPEFLSVTHAYPADVEMLHDVILSLLGRTVAPPPPVMPAALLAVSPTSTLPADYADAVGRAFLVAWNQSDRLHVPVTEAAARDVLKHDPLRIGSMVATMDGRWWRADNLQSGPESVIVYRPGGRLRIDFTADHARLAIPWPETDAYWPGAVHLPDHIELFGREWRARAWERNQDYTVLHLEFSGVLKAADAPSQEDSGFRRLRPASAEMAWSELEEALMGCAGNETTAPIDQLRRSDLAPLGHAILGFAHSLQKGLLRAEEDLQRRLMAIRYLHGSVAPVYGRIPWRIIPAPARDALLRRRVDANSKGLLAEIFDDLPAAFHAAPRRDPVGTTGHPTSPSQAA